MTPRQGRGEPSGGKPWLTHLAVARLLGVSPGTVQQMLNRGDLERRPLPRDRTMPSISAESVERLRPAMEARRARLEDQQRRRQVYRNPPDVDHVWLDTADVAILCGMSRKWVLKEIRLERMPATHHGGQWWVRREHAEVVAAARAFAQKADNADRRGQDDRP